MKVTVQALVIRFRGQIQLVDPVSDMYSEGQVFIKKDSEEYDHIASNVHKSYSGDPYIKTNYIISSIDQGEDIRLSGEVKDICFKVGELEVNLESRDIDWE